MPRWFLVLNGVALLCMGVALLVMRLRERASQNAAAARDRAAARKNWRAAAAAAGTPLEQTDGESAEVAETGDAAEAGPRYRGRVGLRLPDKSAAPVGVFGLFWGILWALLCCAAGIVLLLMSQGHIVQPGREPTTAPPRSRGLEFPSGR